MRRESSANQSTTSLRKVFPPSDPHHPPAIASRSCLFQFACSLKSKKLFFIFAIFLFLIISFSCASAGYTESLQQSFYLGSPSGSLLGSFSSTSPYDSSYCQQGNDFMLQVNTLACTPEVVRSDLLEDQGAAVFCPISSIKLNPMLQIDSFKSVTFSKNYDSRYVSGVTFFPYKSALTTQTPAGVLNSGGTQNNVYNDNIGYAVVYLRQQQNESAMPSHVDVNLTATLQYDSKNVFGLKGNSFYLPVLTDDKWNLQKDKYSFFAGKVYLRAERIDPDKATVSVYSYSKNAPIQGDTSKETKLLTRELKIGQTSDLVSIPGYGCNTGFQFKLDGLENPGQYITLKINSEYMDLKDGEQFLDNNCNLVSDSIVSYGIVKQVGVRCNNLGVNPDGSLSRSRKDFTLFTSPKFNISVDNSENSFGVGQLITTYKNEKGQNAGIYLGYADVVSGNFNSVDQKLVLYLVATDSTDKQLPQDELVSFSNAVKSNSLNSNSIFNWLSKSYEYSLLSSDRNNIPFHGKTFILKGYGKSADFVLSGIAQTYFKNSTNEFDTVISEYLKEKYPNDDTISLGQKAAREKIVLMKSLEQFFSLKMLCADYSKKYSDDNEFQECKGLDQSAFSNQEIVRTDENSQYVISLENVFNPTINDYGVEVIVKNLNKGGGQVVKQLSKDSRISLNDVTGDVNSFIQLENIDSKNNVKLSISVPSASTANKRMVPYDKTLQQGQSVTLEGYSFTIKSINIQRYAKVSINSAQNYDSSKANFHFQIGIEKRAIQLSPDMIKSKIESLNKTIDQWNKISDNMGSVIKGLKTACIASDAVLTLKHLVTDSGGKGIARTNVMTGSNGWDAKCAKMVQDKKVDGNGKTYKTVEDCIYQNSDKIEKEVNDYYAQMSTQNNQIKNIQDKHTTQNTIFGGKTVNTNEFIKDYSQQVSPTLTGTISDPNDNTKTINLASYQDFINNNAYSNFHNYNTGDLKEIDLYNKMRNSATDAATKKLYEQKLVDVLNKVKTNYQAVENLNSIQKEFGASAVTAPLTNPKKTIQISSTSTFGELKNQDLVCGKSCPGQCGSLKYISDKTNAIIIGDTANSGNYLFTLDGNNAITGTYKIENHCISLYEGADLLDQKNIVKQNPFGISINVISKSSCDNNFKENPEVKYYDTDPYKGLPSLVPIDTAHGWYAYVQQTLPVVQSAEASYAESGRVTSFWVCNVGKNGLVEPLSGDDICTEINEGTGQAYNQISCLSATDATNLIKKAENAIQSASTQYNKGKSVSINGQQFNVGSPAVNIPASQCTDFMSPKECQLLFNVCDPVICPSSRCDFGGAYPVKDVIQSGIIGSLVLCLPNWNQGVYIPVCLSGVKAGLDSWISVMQSYRGCLQENLATGKTIGICDEINSVYMCEFFWRQAFPIAKLAIPKILGALTGQNSRGGGEYKGVQAAWQNAQNSINYFTQNYAANAFNAFKYRSAEQIGADVCNKFVSLSYPNGVDILDQMTTPDSPSQFYGRFDEIPYTSATNPSISQYKVFYHIYSGNDRGAYFRVYLTGNSDTSLTSLGVGRMVASGYLNRGDYKSETLDFTAPSGYKQLCINVNGDEECGFGQATTDFAVDYLKDQYVKNQATQSSVTTEKECVSGTASLYSLLNPNTEEGVSNLIDPKIYNQGIIRICATDNPGKSSDTNYGLNGQRWIDVGYCGDSKTRCWLDTNSLANAFIFATTYNKTMNKITADYVNSVFNSEPGKYLDPNGFGKSLEPVINSLNSNEVDTNLNNIKTLNGILGKTFFSNEIAFVHLLKGKIYTNLAGIYFGSLKIQQDEQNFIDNCDIDGLMKYVVDKKLDSDGISFLKKKIIEANPGLSTTLDNTDEGNIKSFFKQNVCGQKEKGFESVWFEYYDGRSTLSLGANYLCFQYKDQQWEYIIGECPGDTSTTWISASDNSNKDYLNLKSSKQDILKRMSSSSYAKGIGVLIDEIINGQDGTNSKTLLTPYALLESSGIFSFEKNIRNPYPIYPQGIYVRYYEGAWVWNTDNTAAITDWIKTPSVTSSDSENFKNDKTITQHYEEDIINYLDEKSFEDGYLWILQGKFGPTEEKAITETTTETSLNPDGPCKFVLNNIDQLFVGTSVNKQEIADFFGKDVKNVNCWDSVSYVYLPDVKPYCIYSDKSGKQYDIKSGSSNVLDEINKLGGPALSENEIGDLNGDGIKHNYREDWVLYIYDKANVNKECVYSDIASKDYHAASWDNIKVELKKIGDPNSCANKDLNEKDKLNLLQPGDIISAYDYTWIIFVGWTDKSNNIAKVFVADMGDPEEYKYLTNIDLSDSSNYFVYQIWRPVAKSTRTIITGDKSSDSFQVNPTDCSKIGAKIDLSESDKLDWLSPGDILSIYYGVLDGKDKPHNVIFVEWSDDVNHIAKVFDWGAFSDSGNFEYTNIDLSDNSHPVYMVWEPQFTDAAKKDIKCYNTPTTTKEQPEDVFKDVVTSPKIRLKESWLGIDGLSRDVCFKYFDKKWHWSTDCDIAGEPSCAFCSTIVNEWNSVETATNAYAGGSLGSKDVLLVNKLNDVKSSLKDGLTLLLKETKDRKLSLTANFTTFSSKTTLFSVTNSEARDNLYFMYDFGTVWKYSADESSTRTDYKKVDSTLDENVLSSNQINLITELINRDELSGAKILFWSDYSPSASTTQTQTKPVPLTLEQAMFNSREMSGKYSASNENKNFVDNICSLRFLTTSECDDIKGIGGWIFNPENSMDDVKNLLITKELQTNKGKWNTISALLKAYLLKGSFTDASNNDLVSNWKNSGLLDSKIYDSFVNKNPDTWIEQLKKYFLDKYNSEVQTSQTKFNRQLSGGDDIANLIRKVQENPISNGYENRDCTGCTSDSCIKTLSDAIKTYSDENEIDPALVLAVVLQESNCNPNAKNSGSGAAGLMQITYGTFNDVCKGKVGGDFNHIFDIRENINCGVLILKNKHDTYLNGMSSLMLTHCKSCCHDPTYEWQYSEYSDWDAALRGYNGWGCGSGADTNYVEKVNNLYNGLKELAKS